MAMYREPVYGLTWKKFIIYDRICSKEEFEFVTGIQLDTVRYRKLTNCLKGLLKMYYVPGATPCTISQFLRLPFKGSKKIRSILDFVHVNSTFYKRITQVSTYSRIFEIENYDDKRAANNLAAWNTYAYPNRFKTFLFKFYSNILGTGNRVIHINPDGDVSCNFCKINLQLPAPIETPLHIFFHCPSVNRVIAQFFTKFFTVEITPSIYFSGTLDTNENNNTAIALIFDVIRYTIWQIRLLKKNISYFTFEHEVSELLNTITRANKKIEITLTNCHFVNLDGRDWNLLYGQDGQRAAQHP